MKRLCVTATALAVLIGGVAAGPASAHQRGGLWGVYDENLRSAKYIDLTHTITPNIPVWTGSARRRSRPAVDPGDRAGLHLCQGRLRGDALRAHDRPARHATRSAGALGAGIPRDRRAAANLRRTAARRDLDRPAGRAGPRLPPANRRHPAFEQASTGASRRERRLRPLRLVEGLARSRARDPDASPACRSTH